MRLHKFKDEEEEERGGGCASKETDEQNTGRDGYFGPLGLQPRTPQRDPKVIVGGYELNSSMYCK